MARLSRLAPLPGFLGLLLSCLPAQSQPVAHEASCVPYVDLHVDLPYQHLFKQAALANGTGQFVAATARQVCVVAVVFPLFVPARVSPAGPRLIDYESTWRRLEQSLTRQSDYSSPSREPGAREIRTFYSFEGMGPFTDDREVLALWVHRGVRLFGLVHNQSNPLAAAALDRRAADYGLTELGRRVVTQIYALGGIVDVSHASVRTTSDVLDLAEKLHKPVVASHSNARRLLDHSRNLDDATIDRIARTGGVIGVNLHSPFLAKGRRATIEDVVNQVRYLVSRVGADHVAFGSDYEGDIRPPKGLASLRDVQRLAQALLRAAIVPSDVRAIMGGNALRLLMGANSRG